MHDPTVEDEAPASNEGPTRPDAPAVELLVEEVSIDGLCGVY